MGIAAFCLLSDVNTSTICQYILPRVIAVFVLLKAEKKFSAALLASFGTSDFVTIPDYVSDMFVFIDIIVVII